MELKLPNLIVSRPDVNRIMRELVSLNDFFVAANQRAAGSPIAPPQVSRELTQLATTNGANLLEAEHRKQLAEGLSVLAAHAPEMHISFSSDPTPKILERILTWFRTNIHPQSLLMVGVQPNLVAGCVLRTPNKWIDMSLRHRLKQEEKYLAELLHGATNE